MDEKNTELTNQNNTSNEEGNDILKGKWSNNLIAKVVISAIFLILAFFILKRIFVKDDIGISGTPVVSTTRIHQGNISKNIDVIGTIMPGDTYYVVTKVSGEITKIYVENGDQVKKGDKICDIDNSKQIESAFIQYDTAKKTYERMEKLYNAGDISLSSFESVKAQYDGYKLAYDTQVEFASPVAVGDGIIENTNMTQNVTINQGTVLCYITSEDAKNIEFGVTDRVLPGIKIGDSVVVEKQGQTYDGTITDVSKLISSTTGLFNIKAMITSENTLASGGMAKVTFAYETSKNTKLLDRDLIYYENNLPFVYTVDKDNKIKKQFVTLGVENTEEVEILDGLTRNTQIVSTWNNSLVEGITVEIVDKEVGEELENLYDVGEGE